jgi:hypothetical protein
MLARGLGRALAREREREREKERELIRNCTIAIAPTLKYALRNEIMYSASTRSSLNSSWATLELQYSWESPGHTASAKCEHCL